jgi:acyl-CoA dehydrogenase
MSITATLPPVMSSTPTHYLFDERHDALRRHVRGFVQRELEPVAEEYERAGRIPKALFERAGEAGLFAYCVPEEFGGRGGDCRMSIVIAEELARGNSRGVSMGFGAHSQIATPHLVRFGTPAQKSRYLPDLVAGKIVAGLGVTEPGAGSNVSGIQTTATRDREGWRLRGVKQFITNGVNGDLFFVAAKTDPAAGHRGISMFLVESRTPGFRTEEMKGKLGRRASDTGRITFDDCRLEADALLGVENQGFYQIMQCFENERLVIAAGCVAAAEICLEETKNYVQQRRYGEGRLSDMQVTRQRMAKSHMELEASRQLVYATAWRVLHGIPSLKEVAMCKAFAAEAAFRIIDDCLQLHGGWGYFDSCPVERAYRDIRLDRIGGGTTEVMYEIIAKQMGI